MEVSQAEPEQEERLNGLVAQLRLRDWKVVGQAYHNLQTAGDAGLQAVARGLTHPSARVRRRCAGFMDHHGTDAGVPALVKAIQNDLVPAVRREAVHSLDCDDCKTNALCVDTIPLILNVIQNDTNRKVRYQAIYALTRRPPDTRTVAVLQTILETEVHNDLRRAAHHALLYNDPDYRTDYNAKQRAAGIAEAKP